MKKETSKDLWESMKSKYQGNKRVQSAQLQRLRRNFEVLEIKEGETISEYFSRVMVVVNDMRNLGEEMSDSKVVEKILRTLVEKFTYVVCAIEESNDIKDLSVDGLQSSLMVHEQKLIRHGGDEQALKIEGRWRPEGGRGRGGSPSRGRGGYQGIGRGSSSFNKETVECYKCHKMGQFKFECPEWEKSTNFVELEEDILLMAHVEEIKKEDEEVWFLDSGCSNHMCGERDWFVDLDKSFSQNVKLGDDRRMMVKGRGSIRLQINGSVQLITSVYFVPGLKSNLLSVGQLQEKGLRLVIDDGLCEIWHKQQKRMIMQTRMSKNRMFAVLAVVKKQKEANGDRYLQVTDEKEGDLWHMRLGHLNHRGIKALEEKKMVTGLSNLDHTEVEICEVCMKGKQIKEIIPKKGIWKSSRGLELVHSDICGPITLISTS